MLSFFMASDKFAWIVELYLRKFINFANMKKKSIWDLHRMSVDECLKTSFL